MKRGILLAAAICFTLSKLAAAEPLQVKLNSYSLWASPALYRPQAGVDYRNFFSSKDAVTPANGELALVNPAQPAQRSGIMFYQSPSRVFIFNYTMNLPTQDADNNGILDIFEYFGNVFATVNGTYAEDGGGQVGTFTARWEKPTESYSGNLYIRYDFLQADFFHQMQCFEYNGTWTPERTGAVTTGQLLLSRNGIEDLILRGALTVTTTANGAARVGGATWKDEFNIDWIFSADADGGLDRGKYVQNINVVDGTPQLGPEDFYKWRLTITDPNNTDGDGFPDILDMTPSGGGTQPIRPTLSIAITANGLRITIEGEAGRTYILESATDPAAVTWTNPQTVNATAASTPVDIARPAVPTFWRARVQQ